MSMAGSTTSWPDMPIRVGIRGYCGPVQRDPIAPPKEKKRLGRPPGSNSEESRRLILEVAGRHLAERGYAATTVKDIAQEAGITSGAVYHYFPSKTELVIAVYRLGANEIVDRLAAVVDPEASLIDNVARFFEYSDDVATDETRRRASLVLSMIADVPRHPELHSVLYETNKLRILFEGLVDAAAVRGEVSSDFDRSTIVNLLIAMMRGVTAEFVLASDEEHRETLRAFQRLIRGDLFKAEQGDLVKQRSGPAPPVATVDARDAASTAGRRAVRTWRRQVARIRRGDEPRDAGEQIY